MFHKCLLKECVLYSKCSKCFSSITVSSRRSTVILPTLQMGKLMHGEVERAQGYSRALFLTSVLCHLLPRDWVTRSQLLVTPDSYTPIPPNHWNPGPAPTPIPEVEPDLITTTTRTFLVSSWCSLCLGPRETVEGSIKYKWLH